MRAIALPQLPQHLEPIHNFSSAILEDETLSRFIVSDQDITGSVVKALSLSEAKLERVTASAADFEKLTLSDILLTHCDVTAANCADAAWRRVQLVSVRCSGFRLQTSTLRDTVFEGCKLNLSNFRYSKLRNTRFIDCVLDEADFYNAVLENVQFQGCSLEKTEFSAAKCKAVDLRGSQLSEVRGVQDLAGATIDSLQLVTISRLLASSLKIEVKDD
ncbi:MAG TPA: pentapeptide repeat-containing protein [Verrucomicrobiae bacterium]|nr:pentapeptide repeat-containing protein [Verrucomicrobiae bacterium]